MIESIGKIPNPKGNETLIAALKDKNWDIRENAAQAFEKRKDPKAVEPLLQMLKEARAQNRSFSILYAENALKNITSIYGPNKDKEWQQWWEENK